MKRKMVSVLLALTMCVGLAIPAFAEPGEEVPTPEETTPLEVTVPEESEVLTGEEDHGHKHEDEAIFYVANAVLVEEIEEDVIVDAYQQLMPKDNTVSPDSMLSITPPIKDHAHGLVLYEQKKEYVTDANQHQLVVYRKWKCSDSTCGYRANDELPGNPEPHSWRKGSLVGYQSSGAGTHKAEYNYSCVCGETTTKSETESHSLSSRYTGNNYHQGTKHYFEYEHKCSQCGYTKTLYKSYSCPGPTGGGCITESAINKVEPPVEELDMTEPEEVTEPEVVDIPEEVEMPEETEAPEETVDTEDLAGPGETVAPDDGESVG